MLQRVVAAVADAYAVYVPSHYRVRRASATDLPRNAERADRGNASVVPRLLSAWSISLHDASTHLQDS